uniref:Uncharacterized protein n=1 Tax=Chenopodium quinoa TaxID=63459 RepID=A0A803MA15_CHEQI
VPQSISQAINESSIVVVPPKPVAIVKQSKTRQTVQPLMILTRSLQEQEQQDKLQAIKDMGFGGFLDLDFPKGKPNFCAMLVQEIEENGMYIKCDRNRSLDITLMDVHLVYGIPYGGEDIVEAKLDDPMFKEVCYFDRLKKKLTFDEPRDFPLLEVWKGKKIRDRIKLELKSGIGLGIMLDRIKVPWTVKNQNLLLKEPKQQEPSPKEQHQEEGFNQQHETKEQHQEHDKTNLNSPTNMQEYNQLLREVTERIASGFVNLSNVLKLGEKFYTAPLVEKNAMYNVAAMWSKCSGYRIPQEIQPQTQFQRGEGSSILSQDNDFFGADWFGNMIDDVVMNVLKSSEFEAMDYDKIFKEAQLENNAVDSVFTNTKNDVEKIG